MIKINIPVAKTITHEERRLARAKEFAPLDEVIMKQIPGTDVQLVESERQVIRDKYADYQVRIDAAETAEELLQVMSEFKPS